MSVNGKVVVITGGSSGVGAAAAAELRRQGATVAITGRSEETERLAREIGAEALLADFARLDDVEKLAQRLLERYPRIDVLANNAGAIFAQRQTTADGHEKTLQVNHLAPFLLTLRLAKRLEESRARVIDTSSDAHRVGRLDFADLENANDYSAWRAYGTAKLMNILHADEINRRLEGVRSYSFHPGVVATGFAREASRFVRWFYTSAAGKLFMLTPQKGADTLVWLATVDESELLPGGYYEKRRPGKRRRAAQSTELARRLWDASIEMLGSRVG